MERDLLDSEIKRFLNSIANNVGNKITEYDWREACGLIKLIDEVNPNIKVDPPIMEDGRCGCDFPKFTWDSPMECENCGGSDSVNVK